MIAIVDYGAGNLQSVQNAFAKAGAEFAVTRDSKTLRDAKKIVLPGVGHFGQMMRALDDLDLRETIRERIRAGVPFLGVCLGFQALYEGSDEAPGVSGLGVFPGSVARFPATARVPHMGWNTLLATKPSRLFPPNEPYVYFAHSYYAPLGVEATLTCEYALPFAAAAERGNCFGVQFHPEKSGAVGLEIVRRFAAL